MTPASLSSARLLALYEKVAEAPGAVPRLRRFVLDLAVRGKLVAQDPGDEPASELLKRIEAEKTRLEEAGEIRKPKALPPVDDEPFDVPSNWRWVRIREVTSDRGQRIPDGDFTYVDVTAINKEAGIVAEPKVLTKDEAPSRARKIAARGDVLYSCVRPYLLNVAILDQVFEPPPIASTAFAVLNGHGLVMPRYLWIALRSPFMVACVEESQRGQAYPAINDADFAVLPFPLPPLAEQRRIVAKVEELMALLDRLEAARDQREVTRDRLTAASLARLTVPYAGATDFPANARFALATLPALTTRPGQIKALRQTILNLAVRGRLVEQNPVDEPASELLKRVEAKKARLVNAGKIRKSKPLPAIGSDDLPFDLPLGWAWARLGTLIDLISGQHLQPPEYSEDRAAGLPYITGPSDFGAVGLVIRRYALARKAVATRGQLLLTVKGSGVGKATICDLDEVAISRQLMALTAIAWEPAFLELLADRLAKKLQEEARSLIPGISREDVTGFVVAFPPLAEQHRIVAKVDALMALCDRLEAALSAADATRARLLEALLHEALDPASDAITEAAE